MVLHLQFVLLSLLHNHARELLLQRDDKELDHLIYQALDDPELSLVEVHDAADLLEVLGVQVVAPVHDNQLYLQCGLGLTELLGDDL